MSILTGKEIIKQYRKGNLKITPFSTFRVNPNSYNLSLADELLVYKNSQLDSLTMEEAEHIKIPKEGFLLQPGKLYLGRTVEQTFSRKYVPIVEGRSSIGRLGIRIHTTAGFGDLGFNGCWTLEIDCVQPVVIYPFIEVCQVYFQTTKGNRDMQYGIDAKYNYNNGMIQPSRLYMDYGPLYGKEKYAKDK